MIQGGILKEDMDEGSRSYPADVRFSGGYTINCSEWTVDDEKKPTPDMKRCYLAVG